MSEPADHDRTFLRKKFLMLSRRFILPIGLAVLLVVSAASIGLDVKSRDDAAAVSNTLGVLKRLSDVQLLVRRAESAARGYALSNDPYYVSEFRDVESRIPPAFAELIDASKDHPGQTQLLKDTQTFVSRRLKVSNELLQLQAEGNFPGIASATSKAQGRAAMKMANENFDKLAAEEGRLLALRSQDSQRTRTVLLGIDIAGGALILLLAALLIHENKRSSREFETSLRAREAENQSLEAAVAERTEHLVAAHEELRHSTEVLQNTFNTVAEAILLLDANGNILLSNTAAQNLLRHREGMSVTELRRLSVAYQTDGTTRLTPHEMPSAHVLRGEPFEEQEIIVRPNDGRKPLHLVVSGRPLRDSAGKISGAALVYHDITSSRETERKLHQAQTLDAIGQLTGGVAHDFNNMLTVITGTTETLVAGLQSLPSLQKTAILIDEAAERCTELIRHLLAFARKQTLQPQNVDINSTVLDVSKLLRPTLGEQIEIQTALAQEVTTSHIDPSQLANSILNMAINARDAMPGGGKLLLETRNVVLDEAYAEGNPGVRPGPYVMLAVSDTGTGMSAAVRDMVFEPFFTTKEVGKGSGLGLSMVYGFVKQSGGHVRIYSEEGHGTTIRLYLPPARGRIGAAASASAPIKGGAETILVVEDDTLVRNFVTVQLHSLGYKAVAAADGPSALALVDNGQPFDLLFTDVIMPGGMTGRQLAHEVEKRRPGTRVLYTSGYTDNAIAYHGRLDEGVLLLTKPYRKPQLAEMVRKALA
jgi:PAS domain S-box-containing protein